jgi:hypothetical protein
VTPSALSARRRFDQALRLWHRALDAYPGADEFCLEINSLIQALRSVTWLLQKDLKHRDGFGPWYAAWQDRMRQDVVLRWLVEARNRIEKEGDLELRSTARVSLIASWLPAPYDEFDVPPLLPPHAIAAVLAEHDIPKELRETGVLRVERRWVTATLPDRELLEACAHVYTVLDALLTEAETQYLPGPASLPDERAKDLEGLVAGGDVRTAFLHLGSGELVSVGMGPAPELADPDQQVRDRYGDLFAKPFPGASFEERCRSHHEIGRRLLEIDGHHQTIAILLRGGKRVGITALDVGDQQAKYLVMDKLAEMVARNNADEVILSTEVWMAIALPEGDAQGHKRAGHRDDRTEGFVTHAVARSGDSLTLMTPFSHDGQRIVLEPVQSDPTLPLALQPILRVWKRDELTWSGARTQAVRKSPRAPDRTLNH